jgi:hypothetical protein
MLTLLLALTASAIAVPNRPYVPTKPAGMYETSCEQLTSSASKLDELKPIELRTSVATSYQQWSRVFDNATELGARAEVPTRVVNVNPRRGFGRSGYYALHCYQPWHCVFQGRSGFMDMYWVGSAVGYTILEECDGPQKLDHWIS